jgi:hypothetical protein
LPDLSVAALVSHHQEGNSFTAADVFRFNVVNLSSKNIYKPFDCFLQVDTRTPVMVTVPVSEKQVLKIIDTIQVSFPPIDLTDFGIHKIRFYTSLKEDERKENDTLTMELYSRAYRLGAVTGFSHSGSNFTFGCNHARVVVEFCRDDIFRIQMAYNGVGRNSWSYLMNFDNGRPADTLTLDIFPGPDAPERTSFRSIRMQFPNMFYSTMEKFSRLVHWRNTSKNLLAGSSARMKNRA